MSGLGGGFGAEPEAGSKSSTGPGPQPGLSPAFLRDHPEVKELITEWPADRIRLELDAVLELWDVLDLTAAIQWRWYRMMKFRWLRLPHQRPHWRPNWRRAGRGH